MEEPKDKPNEFLETFNRLMDDFDPFSQFKTSVAMAQQMAQQMAEQDEEYFKHLDKQQAIKTLQELPVEELREVLSDLSNYVPKTIFYSSDFMADFPRKEINSGQKLDTASQGALMLSVGARNLLEPGESVIFDFTSVSFHDINYGRWKVTLERLEGDDENDRDNS